MTNTNTTSTTEITTDSLDKGMVERAFHHTLHRVVEGWGPDPLSAITAALCMGESVSSYSLEVILEAHEKGPWSVDTEKKLSVFDNWCTKAGTPLSTNDPIVINGVRVYPNDEGDCVLEEAYRKASFATWTKKGRMYIGFKDSEEAAVFRAKDPRLSTEATGNRHVGMIVLEGGDNPETIDWVTRLLA